MITPDDLELSDEELFERIGREVGGITAAQGRPRSYWIKRGRSWFQSRLSTLTTSICANESLRKLWVEEDRQETVVLVTAVADLISSIVTGVSPFTVALLLSRRGLGNICGEWRN